MPRLPNTRAVRHWTFSAIREDSRCISHHGARLSQELIAHDRHSKPPTKTPHTTETKLSGSKPTPSTCCATTLGLANNTTRSSLTRQLSLKAKKPSIPL